MLNKMATDNINLHFSKAELATLQSYLRRIEKHGRNTKPVSQFAVGRAAKSTLENFRLQGRSPFSWPPLKESTLKGRARRRTTPAQILEEFGTLKQSLQAGAQGKGSFLRVARKGAEYGTTLKKAPALQFGVNKRNLPPRPFLYWLREDIDEIMSFAWAYAFHPNRIPRNPFSGVR